MSTVGKFGTTVKVSDVNGLIAGPMQTDGAIERFPVNSKAIVSPSDTPGCPTYSAKYRSIVDETTIVLTASYQTIYTYSGSGKFIGFVASYESTATIYSLTIDSNVIFADVSGITYAAVDLGKSANLDTGGGPVPSADAKRLAFVPRCPISYNSSILIEAKESTGKKHFRYIINLTKET